MSDKEEIFVSTDIETDGPIPGVYSMLSFGSAAYTRDKSLVGTFSANLEVLPGASQHPDTMAFWASNPKAWEACRENPQPIKETLERYTTWLNELPGTPTFVGYPATFDFSFIHWYLVKYLDHDPFGFSGLCVKSYAMRVMKTDFRRTTKGKMPKSWFPKDTPHTHVALDDAKEQGLLFLNMLEAEDCK